MKVFITTSWGIAILTVACATVWLLLTVILYRPIFKRLYDILLSSCAIIVFSPILLTLIILGAIKMRGNPFFTQTRPGKNGKYFKLIKFRTMTNRRGKDGALLSDTERVTRYGKILRATSLDELGELFNIFAGQMSIVGPRPLLVSHVPYYTEAQLQRLCVRPGLTGLAQISGRNNISFEEKFAFDLKYIRGISFFGDLVIVTKTALKVLGKSEVTTGVEIDFTDAGYEARQALPKREIGGDFPLLVQGNLACNNIIHTDKKYTTYFRSGRSGISAILQQVQTRKCFLPVYSCESVYQPFLDEQKDLEYYCVREDFTINEQDLLKSIRAWGQECVVYLQSYFGAYAPLSHIKKRLKKMKGVIIIEDITHSLLNQTKFKGSHYYVASLRKWAGLVEGGMVACNDGNVLPNQVANNDLMYAYEPINERMIAYQATHEVANKSAYRELLRNFGVRFEEKVSYGMNEKSLELFRHMDMAFVRNARRANFNTLSQALFDGINGITMPIKKLAKNETPLYFPIYSMHRDVLQSALIKADVYAPILWQRSQNNKGQPCAIYDQILCLPLDQRFDKDDMLRIIDVIKYAKLS